MKKIISSIIFLISTVVANSQTHKFGWANCIGGLSVESGNSVVTDQYGNIYTTGVFGLSVDFDPSKAISNLSAEGASLDIFISKYNSEGNLVWAKRIGGSEHEESYSISLDIKGNIYVTGDFSGTTDFDPGLAEFELKSNGGRDVFIVKLNSNGNFIWAKQIGGIGSEQAFSIIPNSCGGLLILGIFMDSVDFDPGKDTFILKRNYSNTTDMFLLKMDTSGNFNWVKNLGSVYFYHGKSIVLDILENIFITGTFYATNDFNPDSKDTFNITAEGYGNAFVTKFDQSGNFIWAKQFRGPSQGNSISTDLMGNVYTTGYFMDSVDFDPGAGKFVLHSKSYYNNFISKLDPNGNFMWVKSMNGNAIGNHLVVDSYSDIYTCGNFWGLVDFDPNEGVSNMTSIGKEDDYIVKLDANGNLIWLDMIGGDNEEEVSSISIDKVGNIYTTGWFRGTTNFGLNSGNFKITSNFSNDEFIYKIKQDSCFYMALIIDSVRNITCTNPEEGYASVKIINGTAPYTFKWKDTKLTTASATFKKGGNYLLTATDSLGCKRETTVFLNSPTYFSGTDLNVNLIISGYSKNDNSEIIVSANNDGCSMINGQISVSLDSKLNYLYASPPPTMIAGKKLIWNFDSSINNSKYLTPSIFVTPSSNTKIGDSICVEVNILPKKDDYNLLNNSKKVCHPVGSDNSNSISVYPHGVCKENYVLNNQDLTYVIQFNNTSNKKVKDIYIIDTLDKNLDINSLKILGQSHKSLKTEILHKNILKFSFDNINLVNNSIDESQSRGYLIFGVKQVKDINNMTDINGQATIYFDFNSDYSPCLNEPPSKINYNLNTYYSFLTNLVSVKSINIPYPCDYVDYFSGSINIYPNPNNGNFTIEIDNPKNDLSVEIYNLLGKKIKTLETVPSKSFYSVNMDVAAGMYLIRVKNDGDIHNQKILITK